jgi:hypothetical protein
MPPAATIIARRMLGLVKASVSWASSFLRPINAVVGLGRWSKFIEKSTSSGISETFFLR